MYTPGCREDFNFNIKLKERIEHSNSIQIKLHVEEVNKRGLELKVGSNTYHLSDFEDYSKTNEFSEVLINMKYNDHEDCFDM